MAATTAPALDHPVPSDSVTFTPDPVNRLRLTPFDVNNGKSTPVSFPDVDRYKCLLQEFTPKPDGTVGIRWLFCKQPMSLNLSLGEVFAPIPDKRFFRIVQDPRGYILEKVRQVME